MIDIDYVTAYDAFLNKFMFTFQSRKELGKETNTDLSNNLSGHILTVAERLISVECFIFLGFAHY